MILLLALVQAVSGDAELSAHGITIRTTSRLAGAIDSLRWNGKEFIDSYDHGRQLQSASNLDAGSPIADETFNPTEAGSRDDGTGTTSTSRLLSLRVRGNTLETRSRMAFWLPPGGTSGPNVAKNTTALSDHVLEKRVTIRGPHVLDYDVVFELPEGERHTRATFEAVTGYMPPDFSRFHALVDGELRPLSDGPGEQAHPVILATDDGRFAMGVQSPQAGASYGRFRFAAEKVVKWNCVFRAHDPAGLRPGRYAFKAKVAVGTLEDVVRALMSEEGR